MPLWVFFFVFFVGCFFCFFLYSADLANNLVCLCGYGCVCLYVCGGGVYAFVGVDVYASMCMSLWVWVFFGEEEEEEEEGGGDEGMCEGMCIWVCACGFV